jgi:hypothetical protein
VGPHLDAVLDQVKPWTQLVDEREGRRVAHPVAQERGRLADDVPRGPQPDAGRRRRANELTGPGMVRIRGVETGMKERGIAEDSRRQR